MTDTQWGVISAPRWEVLLPGDDITMTIAMIHIIPMDTADLHTTELKLPCVSACDCGVRTEPQNGPLGLLGFNFIHQEAQ